MRRRGVATLAMSIVACSLLRSHPPRAPKLRLEAPEHVLWAPASRPWVIVTVASDDFSPESTKPIRLVLRSKNGERPDVLPTNELTESDVAVGRGSAAFDLEEAQLPDGSYSVCAEPEEETPSW